MTTNRKCFPCELQSSVSVTQDKCMDHAPVYELIIISKCLFPFFISLSVDRSVRIFKISAGADISMVVSTTGQTYSWGVMKGGRIGLGMDNTIVNTPRQVHIHDENGATLKAVDVDCGYVHSLIVGLNGTVHMCGGIGIDGANDGQVAEEDAIDTSNESGTCIL